jgi:hypothetical protein
VVGFSLTSAWAVLLYVITLLVLLAAFFRDVWLPAFRWARDRLSRGSTLEESIRPVLLLQSAEPPKPFVTIKPGPSDLAFAPPLHLAAEVHLLVGVTLNFDIENEDIRPIRALAAGVRTRDGHEAVASSFRQGVIGPQKRGHVRHFVIPDELVSDLPDKIYPLRPEWADFFLLWAEVSDHAGHTWRVLHDRSTATTSETYELIRPG